MDPLFNASQPIPLHAIAAMLAVILGGVQFALKKGGMRHKLLGRLWVILMLIVAFSSFFIQEFRIWGSFSPIHLLSIWTILSVVLAVHYARIGKIKRHASIMKALYIFGLILTGFFTFLPGRTMHQLLFA